MAIGFALAQWVQPPALPAAAVASGMNPAPVAAPLPAAPAAAPAPAMPRADPPAQPAPLEVAAATAAPVPAVPAPDPVDARMAAGRDLVADPAGPRYAVQLMVTDAREREYLGSYLAEAGRVVEPSSLYLVPAGGSRLAVLLGAYNARAEATRALDALPEDLRQFRPYVRSLDAVREDARRSPAR